MPKLLASVFAHRKDRDKSGLARLLHVLVLSLLLYALLIVKASARPACCIPSSRWPTSCHLAGQSPTGLLHPFESLANLL